ncbi:MAG: hypothetical protein V4555_16480 [Acidobacteriota bacterium]
MKPGDSDVADNPFSAAERLLEESQVIASKRRRRAKGKKGKAAEKEAQEAPRIPFNPQAMAEKLNVWWLKGQDKYVRPAPSGKEWLPEGGKSITRILRLNGVFTKDHGQSHSQADEVIQYIHDHRHVEFAGPVAGRKAGVLILEDGRPIVVTSSYPFVEPEAGEWPLHRALCESLLVTKEEDQTKYLYAWLKTSRAALLAEVARPAPWLVLAGPSNCGKSFLQNAVLTPMLGRVGEPLQWMLDRTQHNADLIGSEHLIMGELPSGIDYASRSNLGEKMKQIAVNRYHRWRGMYQDGFMLPVFWRGSLSINDNVDKLRTLPPMSSDFANKILLLSCEAGKMPVQTDTNDAWEEYGRNLKREQRAFAHFIDNEFEIPPEIQRSVDVGRYGFDVFHHPRLMELLFEQEPERGLLYMIDEELFKGEGLRPADSQAYSAAWGWDPAQRLAEVLRASSTHGAQARKMFEYSNTCGTYLKRLADKYPDRFQSKHTKSGNVWMIHPAK